MREQERKSFQKRRILGVLGLAFGMTFLSCAFLSPRPEVSSPPPPRVEVSPAPTAPPPGAKNEPTPVQKDPPPVPAKFPSGPAVPPQGQPTQAPAPPKEAKPPKAQEGFHVHTVKWSGETLSIIAAWYTGEGGNWKAITQANPNINPNLIFGGDKVLLPESLLKTREPLPREFVDRFYSKAKKEKAPPKDQEEEPVLFGPKK